MYHSLKVNLQNKITRSLICMNLYFLLARCMIMSSILAVLCIMNNYKKTHSNHSIDIYLKSMMSWYNDIIPLRYNEKIMLFGVLKCSLCHCYIYSIIFSVDV